MTCIHHLLRATFQPWQRIFNNVISREMMFLFINSKNKGELFKPHKNTPSAHLVM
jgi:hypothetical protein